MSANPSSRKFFDFSAVAGHVWLAWPAAAFFLALFVRLACVGRRCLSVDEAALLYVASFPAGETMEVMRRCGEVHPPGYFWFACLWAMAGTGEVWLRLSSVIFSSLSAVALFFLARELSGSDRVSFAASLLLAASSFDVEGAVEFRMYPALELVFILSLLFAARLGAIFRTVDFIALFALNCAGASIHFLYAFALPAQLVVAAMHGAGSRMRRLSLVSLSFAGALVLLLCLLPGAGLQDMTLREAPDLWHLLMLMSRMTAGCGFLPGFLLGVGDPWREPLLVFGVVGLSALAASALLHPGKAAAAVIAFILPVAAVFAVSALSPLRIFEYKYFSFVNPLFIYAVSVLLLAGGKGAKGAAVLLAVVAVNLFSVFSAFSAPEFKGPDWRAAAAVLQSGLSEGDAAFVCPGMACLPLRYYMKGGGADLIPVNSLGVEEAALISSRSRSGVVWACVMPFHPVCLRGNVLGRASALFKKKGELDVESYSPSSDVRIVVYGSSI